MEEAGVVDRQGRLVIPSRMRESLGLKSGGDVIIRVDGSRLIVEPRSEEVEKRIEEWVELVRRTKSTLFSEKRIESWKWMSREYARRKLGFH